MPPRRRTRANPGDGPEANPGGFLNREQVAELFAESINNILPALVTQIAQAINPNANPPPEGGGGDGPEPHIIIPVQNDPIVPPKRCTFQTFTRCSPPSFNGTE